MTKSINLSNVLRQHFLLIGVVGAIVFLVSFLMLQKADAAIFSQLDLGDTGSEVTELQTYLATNASIYPEGLITGYFGPLTQAAVQRFQSAQGIVSSGSPDTTGYGRVGPQTIARLNTLMGGGVSTTWDTVPILSNTRVQYNKTSATISWSTNESAQGQVFYSTAPLAMSEATGPRQQPYVSGSQLIGTAGQINHSITLQNLEPNTTYYYLTRAVDSVGNMSMTWPSTFRTN